MLHQLFAMKKHKKTETYSVPEYAALVIPGVKEKAISPQAVVKQIKTTLEKSTGTGKTPKGRKKRAAGLPGGVTAEKYGRFYVIKVNLPKTKPEETPIPQTQSVE